MKELQLVLDLLIIYLPVGSTMSPTFSVENKKPRRNSISWQFISVSCQLRQYVKPTEVCGIVVVVTAATDDDDDDDDDDANDSVGDWSSPSQRRKIGNLAK
ncbi:hypothetical protein M0802_002593 [Mischocyttarus mexicanus]|nr:hypothetical protein M0802_002593 [Mischocyttarus mexicanus]